MKFCKYCGEEIEDTTVICPKCGSNISPNNQKSKNPTGYNSNQNSSDVYIKMKFCKYCGEEIENTAVICPKCGNNTSSNNQISKNPTGYNSNQNSSDAYIKSILTVFSILAVLAISVGVVLLIIGGIQEVLFRVEYDLSGLSKKAINVRREYSNYPNAISFLTAGGICTGVGVLLCLIMIPYRTNHK